MDKNGYKCDLNIDDFYERYQKNYEWLYNGGDRLSDYHTLWEEFEELYTESEWFCSFVEEFCDFIGDMITSDREEAAFILTLHDVIESGMIDVGSSEGL